MPRKKTVISDEQPAEALTPTEATGEENTGQIPEAAPGEEGENIPASGEAPFDTLPSDPPAGEEAPSGEAPLDGEAQPGSEAVNTAESLLTGDMPAPAGEELPADPLLSDAPLGDMPSSGDFPAGEESPFPDEGDASLFPQPQEGEEPESDDPEYGALLHELGEAGYQEEGADAPLTLDPPPVRNCPPIPCPWLERRMV